MTWPSADVITTNVAAGTNSPATARADLLDLITKFNQVRNQLSVFMQGHMADANAAAARATLGAAASGANGDITSLTALAAAGVLPLSADMGIRPLTAAVASNAMTITLNPCTIQFRSPTLTTGTPNNRAVSAALNLVLSAGSTLGTAYVATTNTTYRLYVLAIDATALGGGVELAVLSVAGASTANTFNLDETTLINTTAEGGAGAADTAGIAYSTIARTGVPFRVVGYVEGLLNTTTNGNWTSITTVQGAGGNALAGMSGIGHGQTWQVMTGGRAASTNYYNTTGKPILVALTCLAAATYNITVNGTIIGTTPYGGYATVTFIVPPGASYSVAGSMTTWIELR